MSYKHIKFAIEDGIAHLVLARDDVDGSRIATLGVFYMLTGFNNLITDGADVLPLPSGFQELGQGEVLVTPVQLALGIGDAVFFNPALFHAAGTNRTTDVDRMANLLQVSRLDLPLGLEVVRIHVEEDQPGMPRYQWKSLLDLRGHIP